MSLTAHLQQAHNHLLSEFGDYEKDSALAQQLEDFLNYVVYDKIPPSNSFDEILTKDIADQLKQNTSLVNLFKQGSSKTVGKKGEKAFAQAILEIVKLIQPDILQHTMQTNLKKAIIGQMSATVLAQTITDEEANQLEQQLNSKKSIRKYSLWAARSGKIDVDTSYVEITGEPTPLAKQLLNITASVKNYSSFKIHLENVNRKKAYLAIVSEAYPNYNKNELEGLWQKYQVDHIGNDAAVEEHLQHLINLYALTGYGQAYINKAKGAIERKYARFLMMNNRSANEIRIQSTKKIVLDELMNGSSGFGSRFSQSKQKYEVTYHVK